MEIPESWSEIELKDLGVWSGGGTPNKSVSRYWKDGNVPWVSPKDMKSDLVKITEDLITETAVEETSTRLVEPYSLLMVTRSGILRHSFPIAINIQTVTLNQDMKSVTPFKGVNVFYVFNALKSFTREILDKCRKGGTTVQSIVSASLAEFQIPLPPLAEQKRIVAKIEELFSELDAGVESLRQARAQLGVYRQSLLKQAFSGKLTETWRQKNTEKLESAEVLIDRIRTERESRYQEQLKDWKALGIKRGAPKKPKKLNLFDITELSDKPTLPNDWIIVPYGELCSVVRNGISKKPSGDSGFRISRISAVRPMVYDYDDYRYLDCDEAFAAEYLLLENDLIFTRYNGARRFVGVCALFRGKEKRLYPDKLIRTRPDLPSISPSFLEFALNSGLSRSWMETKIRTTAGQSGVSGGDVKAMPVPLCSLPEQREIVRILEEQFEAIDQNEREIDAALERAEALRQSILKKAFSGQLVPQDPNDEPASVLLERIRAEREAQVPKKKTRKRASKKTVKKSESQKKHFEQSNFTFT